MAKRKHKKKPLAERRIASERIQDLFRQADRVFNESPELSNRYVKLARKIAMKFKLKLKPEFKRKFCKHCYAYPRPGVNCRVRTGKKQVTYSCFNCKRFMRFPIRKKQKQKK